MVIVSTVVRANGFHVPVVTVLYKNLKPQSFVYPAQVTHEQADKLREYKHEYVETVHKEVERIVKGGNTC